MPSVNKVTFLWLCELIWVNKCSFQFLYDCVLFKSRSSINRICDVFLIQLLIKQSRRAGHHCTFNRVYEIHYLSITSLSQFIAGTYLLPFTFWNFICLSDYSKEGCVVGVRWVTFMSDWHVWHLFIDDSWVDHIICRLVTSCCTSNIIVWKMSQCFPISAAKNYVNSYQLICRRHEPSRWEEPVSGAWLSTPAALA